MVPSKSEVGDANVIKDKAKLVGASHKLLICPGTDLNMTLCDLKSHNWIVSRSLVSRLKSLQIQVCGVSVKAPALSL